MRSRYLNIKSLPSLASIVVGIVCTMSADDEYCGQKSVKQGGWRNLWRWGGGLVILYKVIRSCLSEGVFEQRPEELERSMWISGKQGSREQEHHMQRPCGLSVIIILMEQLREVICLEGRGQRGKGVDDGVREVWRDHAGPGRISIFRPPF